MRRMEEDGMVAERAGLWVLGGAMEGAGGM